MADIDAGELFKLAADIKGNEAQIGERVKKVNFKGGMNIKRDWQAKARATSGRAARHYPNTITFDTRVTGDVIETEIGPVIGGQGSLGHILEYGTATNAGTGNLDAAADAEEGKYLDELAKTMADLW